MRANGAAAANGNHDTVEMQNEKYARFSSLEAINFIQKAKSWC